MTQLDAVMKHFCHHGGPRFYSNFFPLLQPDEVAQKTCVAWGFGGSGEVGMQFMQEIDCLQTKILNMENSKIWQIQAIVT